MKRKTIIVAVLLIVGLLSYFGFQYFSGSLISGGGSEQLAPDTVQAGDPAVVTFIVTATGGGGNIKGRFTDMSLHYRLVGETEYGAVQPQSIPLPDNFKTVQSKTFQSEAYQFSIPPYSQGTSGEIEYYIELIFDGYQSRQEGIKKIMVNSPLTIPTKIDTSPNKIEIGTNPPITHTLEAPTSSLICHESQRYFVIEENHTGDVGSDHLIKYKNTPNQHFDCEYIVEKGETGPSEWTTSDDFEIKNEGAEYFLALEGDFLILDSGTGPQPRGLIIYDLKERTKIFSDRYSRPISVSNNTIDYWAETQEKVTKENCLELATYEAQGLGAAIEAHVILNLSTFNKHELGDKRCASRQ